ncbi:ankyrin repeat domain-containing protein [Aestuariibius sp. 2305UL40-4]|uniref:ankyrin repeat domain-containing protein n=1 Tax=Aestuariibius violaceus TaxID=3234132 RepID=UPI00345ECBDC
MDLLDPGAAITLADQCHAAGAAVPDDPCDVRLFYRAGGAIENLTMTPASIAADRERLRACVQTRRAAIEALEQNRRDLATPLHDVISSGGGADAVAAILEETGDTYVNVTDTEGVTPLHSAMTHGADPEIVSLLLEAGADPNAEAEEFWPVYHYAIINDVPREVLSLLIEGGADPTRVLINEDAFPSYYQRSDAFSLALDAGYGLADLKWIYAQGDLGRLAYRRPVYFDAIHYDNPSVLEYVTQVSDPPEDSIEATELLFEAAYMNAHPEVIAKIFELGADGVRSTHHSNGRSVLHYVIHHPQDLRTIRALIENGATMGEGVSMDSALLVAAARHPDPELLRYLVSLGIDTTVHQNFRTAISFARRSGENAEEKVAVLQELGFVEEFTCRDRCPGLLSAITRDRPVKDIRAILEGGGNIGEVNRQGNGVLHLAALNHDMPEVVIPFLIEAGADPDLKNAAGETPLVRALGLDDGNPEAATLLLRYGADPDILAPDGTAPIFMALETSGDLGLLRAFDVAGVDMEVRNAAGETPVFALLSSMAADQQLSLRVLVSIPHDVGLTDANGDTALHVALKTIEPDVLDPSVIRYVMDAGYDANAPGGDGVVPLHRAIERGHHSGPVLSALLAGNADPNQPNAGGLTALHLAAMGGFEAPVFATLLEHGADPQARTPEGVLPVTLLKANRQMRRTSGAEYKAALAELRRGGGGTNVFREWHLAGWTPWIGGGLALMLVLGAALWRLTRPVRII